MKVKVYVEGGGNSSALKILCRKGFTSFFDKAGFGHRMPGIVACGSRYDAYEDFCRAVQAAGDDEFVFLLVDSEGDVKPDTHPWTYLKDRAEDRWIRPDRAEEDSAHLMVQCMEAWLVADRQGLASYYGSAFNGQAIPANPQVEQIPKDDLLRGLENATRFAQKGRYSKGKHSFEILARVNVQPVLSSCPSAKRLVDALADKLSI